MSGHTDEPLDSWLLHVSLGGYLFCTDEFLPDSKSSEGGSSPEHEVWHMVVQEAFIEWLGGQGL